MVKTTDEFATPSPESEIHRILEWIALAHGRQGSDDAHEVLKNLIDLREAAVSPTQNIKLLDLLYNHVERIVRAELNRHNEVSLPISRKHRQRIRILIELLETLAQDYLNHLAILFDPECPQAEPIPQASLRRALLSIAWQIRIQHAVASPLRPGLWQQFHNIYFGARRLGLDTRPGPRGGPSIQRIYLNVVLAAIAQPASFSAEEQEFIATYVEASRATPELSDTIPSHRESTFWITPDRDVPAHALTRRSPGEDLEIIYFSCEALANAASAHRKELQQGLTAADLELPAFAETHAGRGILGRLERLWGTPSKRRFPRRRQYYRARLSVGLDTLCKLIKSPNADQPLSEWMIINESPDGFALMHIAGAVQHLHVGDIVALQAQDETHRNTQGWQICLIRWAISENPEHIEIGLQLIATEAVPTELARPGENVLSNISALLLPKRPPLRSTQALIVPPGILEEQGRRCILIIEKDNLEIREVQPTLLDEQTSSIEIYAVEAHSGD